MPEPRRRAAFRNLIDGLFINERIQTTEARAKAVHGEAEELITTAIRGHRAAMAHLKSVVDDDYIAEQVLALARKGRFRVNENVGTNEERATQGKFPLRPESRRLREDKLAERKKELLTLIKDPDAAQVALDAARQAMAIELHARRTILKHLPHELTVRKIFEQFVPRYINRRGGYTRITKIGFRQGDGAHMVQLELV
ncbi:MAG TPA: bL17 family ribosomal protein [Ktedonobacterales bacterium]|jgi:ribosomal protein L17|nr:bL17 family ribosomal protein [Ktedonobacterales bacterium]